MYKYRKSYPSLIKNPMNMEGETIENKVRRIMTNKEPIKDGAPLIYTDRADGVLPGYNIRTDRFEVAADAMDKVTKSKVAKREERQKSMKNVTEEIEKMKPEDKQINKVEPTAGKS